MTWKRLLPLTCLALLLAACQGFQKHPIFPFPYEVRDLANGLRSITVTTPYPDIVALYIVVQVGSRHEVEPGRTGFAHLFEHMMFRGTDRFPSQKWEAIMQASGAENNAFTSDDITVYYAVFPKEDLAAILELEADRFQNLNYSIEEFQTESRAVLGEYNKSFANPMRKLDEAVRKSAFSVHTYGHSPLGFLEDIEKMPQMYDYGLQFFDRYYRPEHTILCLVGDITAQEAEPLVDRYWGAWQPGHHQADIPPEPPQEQPKRIDVPFHAPTLPILSVSFHAPAYDDQTIDSAVLDVVSSYAFSENSELYKKLVIQEQKVDVLFPAYYDHRDPFLFSVVARIKKAEDLDRIEEEILETFESLKREAIPDRNLENVKSHLRYQFALDLDSTASIARTLVHFVGLRRTPETINKRYRLYERVTASDVQSVARKVFVAKARTIARLEHQPQESSGGKP